MRACLALVAVNIPAVALVDGVHSRSFSGARRAGGGERAPDSLVPVGQR
jgi:hypothetical protein